MGELIWLNQMSFEIVDKFLYFKNEVGFSYEQILLRWIKLLLRWQLSNQFQFGTDISKYLKPGW